MKEELSNAERVTWDKVQDYAKANNVSQNKALRAVKGSPSTFYKAKRKMRVGIIPKPKMMTLTVHEPIKNITAFYGDPNAVIEAIKRMNGVS